MNLERKTIFLYPEAAEMDKELYKATSQLITRIRKIARISNKTISDILYNGCFSHIKCKPSVSMRCIGQNVNDDLDCSNVRICVVKYNGIDYTDNYEKILNDLKTPGTNISHLVALHIFTNTNKKIFKFRPDENKQFDAIVETDLNSLEHLLIAIMLDISLYHYFLLSHNISDRRAFNKIKFDYITSHFSEEDVKKIYGEPIDKSNPIYLPFSMERVTKLGQVSAESRKNSTIKDLIQKYCEFLASSAATKIVLSEKGYIANSNILKKDDCYDCVEKCVETLRSEGKLDDKVIILVTNENLTKNSKPIIVQYVQETFDNTDWINMLSSGINNYKIFEIDSEA